MSFPYVINEVASAISAVIHVIAWSVIKALPILVAILIGLIAIDIVIGSVFENEAPTGSPFLSGNSQAEIQLSATESISANPAIENK